MTQNIMLGNYQLRILIHEENAPSYKTQALTKSTNYIPKCKVVSRQRNGYEINYSKGATKPYTQLHSAPSTSTQLHPPPPSRFQPPPSSIHLHPTHFSLHLALCNTLNNIRSKISDVIG